MTRIPAGNGGVMLHFLLGTALCLFIGGRLVRYWSAWRL